MARFTPERELLTPPQIAKMWGCSTSLVLELIRSGQVKAVNLGQSKRPRWRISREELDRFLESRTNYVLAGSDDPPSYV